jgi:hypothetical protein
VEHARKCTITEELIKGRKGRKVTTGPTTEITLGPDGIERRNTISHYIEKVGSRYFNATLRNNEGDVFNKVLAIVTLRSPAGDFWPLSDGLKMSNGPEPYYTHLVVPPAITKKIIGCIADCLIAEGVCPPARAFASPRLVSLARRS